MSHVCHSVHIKLQGPYSYLWGGGKWAQDSDPLPPSVLSPDSQTFRINGKLKQAKKGGKFDGNIFFIHPMLNYSVLHSQFDKFKYEYRLYEKAIEEVYVQCTYIGLRVYVYRVYRWEERGW